MKEAMFQTNRHNARARKREPSSLLTVTGRVRSIALTSQGHVSCVIDGPAGRLRVLSDASTVHLPELRPGRAIRAELLRLQRVTEEGNWQWQLLAAQGAEVRGDLIGATPRARSAA
jgi:hypothetical protein